MAITSFAPTLFTWKVDDRLTGIHQYTDISIQIAIYNNVNYDTYKTWLNSDAVLYINPSSLFNLNSSDLTSWANKFPSYNRRAIQVQTQFNPIQNQGMSGGFCIYIKSWSYNDDPNNPLIDQTGVANVKTEELGITCNVAKARSGPTVDIAWNSQDFRSFWLPLRFKTNLDTGSLDLFDDALIDV